MPRVYWVIILEEKQILDQARQEAEGHWRIGTEVFFRHTFLSNSFVWRMVRKLLKKSSSDLTLIELQVILVSQTRKPSVPVCFAANLSISPARSVS